MMYLARFSNPFSSFADMYVEAAVMPRHPVFDNGVGDFSLFLEHGKNLIPESLVKVLCCKAWRHLKTAVFEKTPLRHDSVDMGIEIQKIAVRVYGNAGPGRCTIIQGGGSMVFTDNIPRAFAQL
jgi:hypothetical protein